MVIFLGVFVAIESNYGGLLVIIPIYLVGVLIFVFLPYSIYLGAYIKRYYYDVGDNFISIQKGVFGPTEIHVQYPKIQDVYVDQDIFDRIFRIYDVHIASATATSGIEAHIDGVNAETAEVLKNMILGRIQGFSEQSGNSQPTQSQASEPRVFTFDNKISSETYPISSGWLVSKIPGIILVSAVYTYILFIFLNAFKFNSLALVIFVFLVCFAFNFFWKLIWKSKYYFEFMPEYILQRTGIISRQEKHLPYRSIQNVTINQSWLDRLLNISNINIENAAQITVGSGRNRRVMNEGVVVPGLSNDLAQSLLRVANDVSLSKSNPSQMGL
ncbi:MAG: PH domain-containing protein [Minisyncoccia bacterium]